MRLFRFLAIRSLHSALHNVYPRSHTAFAKAKQLIPGGVNSPARAFGAVGGEPLFIERAQGAYLYDIDGHKLIDYIGSWGPMIVGHAHPAVVDAIREAATLGTSYGAPTERETELAQIVVDMVPSIEKGSLCQFRDRSDNECDTCCAWFHWSQYHYQIRRLLSWPRR